MKFLKEMAEGFAVAAMIVSLLAAALIISTIGLTEYRQWFTVQTIDITAKALRAPRNDEHQCRDHPQDWAICLGGPKDGDWLAGERIYGAHGSYNFGKCQVVGDGYGWRLVPNKSGPQCTVNGEPFPYAGGKG
jgi:hypothetical protein